MVESGIANVFDRAQKAIEREKLAGNKCTTVSRKAELYGLGGAKLVLVVLLGGCPAKRQWELPP
jgi:hypothetical protein